MHRKIFTLLLCFLAAGSLSGASNKTAKADTLIVPGERIGDIKLGLDDGRVYRDRGEPDGSDAAMGGKGVEWWFIGEHPKEKGRPFHRLGEIGCFSLKDMEHDSAAHPGKVTITGIFVTSPKFATAGGIAPGATLDAIRAKFPDIQPDKENDRTVWPLYGEMQFFMDAKRGIGFAIRKKDGVCTGIAVVPGEGSTVRGFFRWTPPDVATDYVIDDIEGTVGEIKLGMTAAKLTALLGKPDETRDVAPGVLWRWRLPAQTSMELPGLCVSLRKLPDGALIVDQIRVTSHEFALTDKIFPSCPLKDALNATANITKFDSYKDRQIDIYGDLRAGLLFDVRESDSICTAITIFPPVLQNHPDMTARWLDVPAAPDGGD